jgi:hypothetical protein
LVLESFPNAGNSDLPLFTGGMPALLYRTENNNNLITLFGQNIPKEKLAVEVNTTLIAYFFKPFSLGPIFKLSAQELKEKALKSIFGTHKKQWHSMCNSFIPHQPKKKLKSWIILFSLKYSPTRENVRSYVMLLIK